MSLKANFARGSGWMVLGASADFAMQFVVFAILARILSVSDLGVVAFALVLTDLGRIIVNGGTAELTVQRATWDDRFGSVCFTLTMILAVVCALLLGVVGGMLVEYHYRAGSGLPTAALSLIFLIEASRAIHGSKLRREFRYKELAGRAAIGTVIAGGIAVVLALRGWGVWALVMQRLLGQSVTTVLTWRAAKWRPQFLLDRAVLREIAPFSIRVTLFRALEVLNQRMPDLLVAVLLGPVAVAIYRVGARSLEAIIRIIVQPFQDAAFSALSRVGEPAAIGQALGRVTRAAALVVFPVFLGAAAVGTELTVLLFGAKYVPSGAVMTVLAIGGVSATMLLIISSAYLAAAQTRALLTANIAAISCNVVAIAIGSLLAGPTGAAAGTALTQLLMAPVGMLLMRRYLHLSPRDVMRGLATPLVAAALMALTLAAVRIWALPLAPDMPLAVRLVVLIGLGGVLYPAFLLIAGRRYLAGLLQEVRPLLPGPIRRFVPVRGTGQSS